MTPDEFAKFIGTLTGSAEAAALAKEVATDPVATREKIRVPKDAGEYAPDDHNSTSRVVLHPIPPERCRLSAAAQRGSRAGPCA